MQKYGQEAWFLLTTVMWCVEPVCESWYREAAIEREAGSHRERERQP